MTKRALNNLSDLYRVWEDRQQLKQSIDQLTQEKNRLESQLCGMSRLDRYLFDRKTFICSEKQVKTLENQISVKKVKAQGFEEQLKVESGINIIRQSEETDFGCMPPNSEEVLLELAALSSRTDAICREKIRSQVDYMPEDYWTQRKIQGDAYWFPSHSFLAQMVRSYHQVQRLPQNLVLLRTLAYPGDSPVVDELPDFARSKMRNIRPGDTFRLDEGTSTSCQTPSWLGATDVLLIIKGVKSGVPMFGRFHKGEIDENEVYLAETVDCKVTRVERNFGFTIYAPPAPQKWHFDVAIEIEAE